MIVLRRAIPQAEADEAEQLAVLDNYASGILSALNQDGLAPFDFATVHSAQDPDAGKPACRGWPQKGPGSLCCAQKLTRLQAIVAKRTEWSEQVAQIKRLQRYLCLP